MRDFVPAVPLTAPARKENIYGIHPSFTSCTSRPGVITDSGRAGDAAAPYGLCRATRSGVTAAFYVSGDM